MHDRIIIRNMVSQISIEYEKESDITARKELIKRGERYAADRTMFLRDINIYDDRVYQQDESIVCSASFPVIGSYAGMSDICNISENVNKIDNARLIRKDKCSYGGGCNIPYNRSDYINNSDNSQICFQVQKVIR